jgi:hypothetical protein
MAGPVWFLQPVRTNLTSNPNRSEIQSMKRLAQVVIAGLFVFGASSCLAQGRSPTVSGIRGLIPGGGYPPASAAPGTPGTPAYPAAPANPAPPPKPAALAFSDLQVSEQFYFTSDTNRNYAWMKVSSATASNTVNHRVVAISATTKVTK